MTSSSLQAAAWAPRASPPRCRPRPRCFSSWPYFSPIWSWALSSIPGAILSTSSSPYLSLGGALWVVFLNGSGLDVFGLLGMLMLIGLSAKNAILYLDFVVERIGKMPLEEALIESGGLRFRPIVMTTLTVLVTSFPLVFGSGQGSEFGRGLGLVTFGGILFSAVLTFFVVPAAFYLFERKRVVKTEAAAPAPKTEPSARINGPEGAAPATDEEYGL